MRILLISNSTNPGEGYLEHAKPHIKISGEISPRMPFYPYAAVTFTYDEYEKKVNDKFEEIGHHVTSITSSTTP